MTFIRCKLSSNVICIFSSITSEVWYNELFSISFVELALDKFRHIESDIITVEKLNNIFN